MTLAQIVILLQAVLGLLSAPQAATNPQAQALAQQAVLIATEALQNQTTTVGTVSPAPVNYTVPSAPTTTVVLPSQPTTTINIGSPAMGSIQAPLATPSCTLTVQHATDNPLTPMFTWTSNVSNPVAVILWRTSSWPNGTKNPWVWSNWYPPLQLDASWNTTSTTNKEFNGLGGQLLNGFSWNGGEMQFELQIGGASCDYTLTQ